MSMTVDIYEGDLRIPGEAANPVPEPFARDKYRTTNMETKCVVFKRRPVPVSHEEPDQPLVGGVHLILAAGE